MKRIIALLITAVMLFAFTSCDVGITDKSDTDGAIGFTATEVSGVSVNSSDIFGKNKVTMINIWASWCGPCVGELAELQELSERLKDMDCGLIGILDDGDTSSGLETAKRLIDDNGLDYTVVISNDEIRSQLPIQYYPTTFFVDGEGRLIGEPIIGAQVDKYLPAVQKLLDGMEE